MTHDVRSSFISTMWLVNFFLEIRTLKQELQGKETSGKGTIMPDLLNCKSLLLCDFCLLSYLFVLQYDTSHARQHS